MRRQMQSEAELAQLRTLYEHLDEAVCFYERLPTPPGGLRDYRYISMNRAMQTMFGIEDLSGRTIRECFPHESESWYDDYDRVLATGEPIRIERRSDPQAMALSMFVSRVEDSTRSRLMAVIRDITASRLTEAALKLSEERYRALVTATSDTVYRMSPDWSEMWELVGKEFIKTTNNPLRTWLEQYIPPEERERVLGAIQAAISGRQVFELEHKVWRVDGTIGWTFSRAVPQRAPDGEIVEWFGAASDITDRKRYEVTLKASEERQAFLLKLSDALRSLHNATAIEAQACQSLGEHIGVDRAYFVEVDESAGIAIVGQHHSRNELSSLTGRHQLNDSRSGIAPMRRGERLVVTDVTRSPLVSAADIPALTAVQIGAFISAPLVKDGRLVGALCVTERGTREWTPAERALVVDVGDRIWAAVERAKAEAAFRESQNQYRMLAANLPNGAAFVLDRDLRYRLAEGEALKMAGFGREQFEGKTIFEVLPTHLAAAYELNYRQALAGKPFRAEHQSHGHWFITHGAPLYDEATGEVTGVLAVSYDITSRKLAEQQLDAEQRRFQLVVQNLRDYAIFLLDPHGIITGWWEGATLVTEYRDDEARGHHFRMFYPPELANEPDLELAMAAESGRFEAEGWRLRKDGTKFWVNEIVTAIHDAHGELLGFAKIARDLTEQRHSQEQLRVAKDAAESASQMKDEFLATLSHELRTPLAAILLWARMLDRDSDEANLDQGLHAIRNAADAQNQLINDLLDTSRISSGKLHLELQPTEIGPVVNAAVESVFPAAQLKDVEIQVDVGTRTGIVQVDPNRIKQVVWNLLTNAIKFTSSGGIVKVKVERLDHHISIRVQDSGKGISAEFLPHVFELFRQADSSTTRAHGGLGLGLAICRKLVEQHGGVITAESDGPNRGATFTVILPLPISRKSKSRGTNASPANASSSSALKPLQDVHILLVEDDQLMRTSLTVMLRKAGANVTEVESAALAFTAFTESRPDVLLSDIGMPDEDGYSLLQRIRAKEKASRTSPVPAIALTAYAAKKDQQKALAVGFQSHHTKPIDPVNLINAVATLLRDIRNR